MKGMKLRLIAMGCILSVLGIVFYEFRGHNTLDLALLGIGIVLLVAGLIWQ